MPPIRYQNRVDVKLRRNILHTVGNIVEGVPSQMGVSDRRSERIDTAHCETTSKLPASNFPKRILVYPEITVWAQSSSWSCWVLADLKLRNREHTLAGQRGDDDWPAVVRTREREREMRVLGLSATWSRRSSTEEREDVPC